MPDSVGLKMEVLDEEKFKAALKDVSASVKLTTSEMKKLTADYNGNANSITALEAKDRSLNQLTEEQKKKIQMLRDELGRAKDAYGEDSTKVKELQTKLNDAETALSKTTTQVKENNKYLKEAKSSSDGCATSIDKFGKQAKAAAGEVKTFGEDVDKSNGKTTTFSTTLKSAFSSENIKASLGAIGVATAGFLGSSIKSAEDAEKSTQQVSVLLQNQGMSAQDASAGIQKFTKSITDMSAYSGGEAKAALTALTNKGIDFGTAMQNSTLLADVAAGSNTSLADAADLLANAYNGKTKALTTLGILSKDEVKQLGDSEDATITMADVQQRLNERYGGAAQAQLGTYAGQQKELENNFKSCQKTIGDAMLPVLTQLMQAILPVVQQVSKFVQDNPKLTAGILAAVAAIGTVVGGVSMVNKVTSVLNLGGIAGKIASFLPSIGLVGIAIAGVAAAAILIIKNWGPIKDFFKKLWDDIKGIFSGVGEWFSNVFQGAKNLAIAAWDGFIGFYVEIWDGIKQVFSGVGNWFSQKFTEAKNLVMAVWNGVPQLFSGIAGKIGGAFSGIGEKIKSGFETGVNFIKELPGEALQWGKDMISNFVNGIKQMAGKVEDAAKDVAGKVKKFLHFSKPDEGPLADFDTYGPDMMQTFADGIRKNTGKVSEAARLAAASISDGLNVGTTVNVRGIASPYGAAAGGITTVNHTGVITIRGVNDQGQFVAAYDYVVDRMRREGRMA